MFDEFFGVQMHPLAVHAPVVLIPIFAVATIVLLVRGDWRRRVGVWMAGGVAFTAVLLFVARQSGYAAYDDGNGNFLGFGDVERHRDLGDQTFVLGVLWTILFAAVVFVDRRRNPAQVPADLSAGAATSRRDPVVVGLSVLSAVAAVSVTVWLVRTGHAGAESRWG